jgi:hypothetical protein
MTGVDYCFLYWLRVVVRLEDGEGRIRQEVNKVGELSIEDGVEVVRREGEDSGRVKQRGGPTKVAAVSGA